MKISSIGEESIRIVIEILNKRIEWIRENEPHAVDEIEEDERTLETLHNLIKSEINN